MSKFQSLRAAANERRNPRFTEDMRGATMGGEFAHGMLGRGELTEREFKDFIKHHWRDLYEKSPPEQWDEMMKDGSLNDLDLLARGVDDDDDRDGDDIIDAGKAANLKVMRAALEGEWQGGRIDSRRYAQLHSDHIGRDSRVDRLLAAGEEALEAGDTDRAAQIFDHAASAVWALGHQGDDHEADLEDYIDQKYRGEKPRKRIPRSSREEATDAEGVIDLDKLEKLEAGEDDER
jgi:hypothetical protein